MIAVPSSDSAPAVWQVSGGPTNRPYGEVFLRHGVALIGPGDPGPWTPERYAYDWSLQGFIGRFAQEVKEGDVLLLRSGLSTIVAVGMIVGEYLFLDAFDDVNGWDLQHARRVRWFRLPEPYSFAQPVFGASPTRISRVQDPDTVDYALRFVQSPPDHWKTAPLPDLPAEEPALDVVPTGLQEVVATVLDLVPLMRDGARWGDTPSESELVAHFVVPFVRALGWPLELIAVEWRRLDVALFAALPRTASACRVVIEAKRLDAGVEGALEQAKGYVASLQPLGEVHVVVTDGVRYRMFGGPPEFDHLAYANLVRLKRSAETLFSLLRRP